MLFLLRLSLIHESVIGFMMASGLAFGMLNDVGKMC